MIKRTLGIILVIGVILRLIVSASTYHPDIAALDFAGKVIGAGNISNFYDYLYELDENSPILDVYPRYLFNYPPAPYFTWGINSIIVKGLVSESVHHAFMYDLTSVLGTWQLSFLLLLLKIPYIFFDIAVAFLLMSFFKSNKKKVLIFALWIFNPVSIYATYMVGQFDIIPTFFVILSLYVINKHKNNLKYKHILLSAIILGLGAAFKIYPFLLLVPVAVLEKKWFKRILAIATGIFVYMLTILPFINSVGFRSTALVASQTTKSLYAQIPVSGGESIMLFLAILVFFYIVFWFQEIKAEDIWQRFLVIIMLFFVLTHFHPQWFLWVTPFIIIDLVKSWPKHVFIVLIILASLLGMILFFDPGLSIGLFSPITPTINREVSVWQMFGLTLDYNYYRSIIQSVFVGVALYYFYLYFPKKRKLLTGKK